MSFTLPSHIEQRAYGYYDTVKNSYISDKWIKWYCKQYWESIDINHLTGKPIKRRVKKDTTEYKPRIDWDAYDKVEVTKEIYKEKII